MSQSQTLLMKDSKHILLTGALTTTATSSTSSKYKPYSVIATTSPLNRHSSPVSQISISSSYNTMTDEVVTPERCHSDSSSILEYQQLYNRYAFCLANLHESIREVEALRLDNESLRLANADLLHRLCLLSQATIHTCLLSDFNHLRISGNTSPSPRLYSRVTSPSPAPSPHLAERVSIPKSISIRSSGSLTFKPQSDRKNETPTTQSPSQKRVNSPSLPDSEKARQRVYVAGGEREEEALQFEVYDQGMSKTELCNKWQESGSCPFAENCQFAHGITELRPVIRHPRYKTEVCRMVLAGDICPYGHRCHFRHSLADLS